MVFGVHGRVGDAAVGSISGVPHGRRWETGVWVRVAESATLIGIGAQKPLVTTRLQLTWRPFLRYRAARWEVLVASPFATVLAEVGGLVRDGGC